MLICTPVLLPNAAQITGGTAWAGGGAHAAVFYGIEPLHLSLLSELNKGLGTG